MESIKDKLEKDFINNSILLLSVSGSDYRTATSELIALAKKFRMLCYVTLNDPSDAIKKKLGEDAKNVCFIDCVTATVRSTGDSPDTIFVSSPRALTEISIAVRKSMEKFRPDALIFDSISALLVYEKSLNALKFLHNIILTIRSGSIRTIFVVLKEDVSEELMKDASMFVDKVVEI